MIPIDLPRLVSSRESARRLVGQVGAFRGQRVVVNCRELRSATQSFVDELVEVTLASGGASELVVLAGSPDVLEQFHRAARSHGVDDRIVERPAGSEVQA